jgi:hypothetical protein
MDRRCGCDRDPHFLQSAVRSHPTLIAAASNKTQRSTTTSVIETS